MAVTTHRALSIGAIVMVAALPAGAVARSTAIQRAADALRANPPFQTPLRGSITLPDSAADVASLAHDRDARNVRITWRSSDPAIVSDTDKGIGDDVVRKGSVTRGMRDRRVRLTATLRMGGAPAMSVPLDMVVPARAGPLRSDLTAYMFVYFTGDTVAGEKLRFAVSDGNNALQWKALNAAQPVLESTLGTRGLRDPFILRSAEGDRFFLLATDLSTGRTGWGGSTDRGSAHIEIWESTDLVNWGRQRHVRVNLPNAGMTWAPEATYDPTIDAYVVYWTSTAFTDAARTAADGNGPQIFMATTRDFRTFTVPRPWFRAADLPELVKGKGMIDTTVLRDGGYYYRFTKVTQAAGCPSPDIIAQRSPVLRAPMSSGAWTMVDRCIGRTAGTPEVEGPSAFVANDGDVSGLRYFLWVDHYNGVGYIPLGTNSLQGNIRWTYPTGFHLPVSPRHGSVLSITAREHDALAAKWNRALLVASVAPVSVSVPPDARTAALPPTVMAAFADGHSETVGVAWPTVDLSGPTPGAPALTIRGRLDNSAATPAVATITRKVLP